MAKQTRNTSKENDEVLKELQQIAADLKVLEEKQLAISAEAKKILEEDTLDDAREKLKDLTE